MEDVFTFPKLPQVKLKENEQDKALPPMEGREIITRSFRFAGKDIPQIGYYQRYTNTIKELTVLVEQLGGQNKKEIQEMRRIQEELRLYLELPRKVEKFMAEISLQLEQYRNHQTAELEQVSNILDELLAGKAKPSGDMMNLILDAINAQKEKLELLDNKVTLFLKKQ